MSPSEQYRGTTRRGWLLLVVLVGLAAGSAFVGAMEGMHRSQDFQWSGTHVLLQHMDPWAEYLRGDPQHRFVLAQAPDYLPILYLLLAPLGMLSLHTADALWVLCNLAFALGSAVLAARFYGLRGRSVAAVACLMLMSTQVRNTVGNGQQGLLVLFLWCLTLTAGRLSGGSALASGVAYFKYNFAPAMAMYVLFRWGWRAVLLTVAPVLLAAGVVWLWLTGGHDPGGLLRFALEPLKVAQVGYLPRGGGQNLMDVMDPLLLARVPAFTADVVEMVAALAICAVVSWFAFCRNRERAVEWQVAVMATLSFGLFRHHNYDGVVLLLPFCYALARWREMWAQVVLGVLAYLFYGQRMLEAARLHPRGMYPFEFVLVMVVLGLTYRMGVAERVLRPQTVGVSRWSWTRWLRSWPAMVSRMVWKVMSPRSGWWPGRARSAWLSEPTSLRFQARAARKSSRAEGRS